MYKKIFFNLFLLIVVYIIPLYVFHQYQNDWRNIYVIQNCVLSIIFLGSVFIIYLNFRYIRQALSYKWLWIIFEVVGIIGLGYSAFILFLIFSLRNLFT